MKPRLTCFQIIAKWLLTNHLTIRFPGQHQVSPAERSRLRNRSSAAGITWRAMALTTLGHAAYAAAGTLSVPAGELSDCNAQDSWRVVHASARSEQSLPARAVWLDGRHIFWSGATASASFRLLHATRPSMQWSSGTEPSGADDVVELTVLSPPTQTSGPAIPVYLGTGVLLRVPDDKTDAIPAWLKGQVWLSRSDATGATQEVTRTQHAAALDAYFAPAAERTNFGVQILPRSTSWTVWAPTAHSVSLCLHPSHRTPATRILAMQRDAASGAWSVEVPRRLHG